MKSKVLILIISLMFVVGYGHQVDAGFQDWLKDTAKKMGGEKRLGDDEIISGLKQALEVGTGNAVTTVSQLNGYSENPKIRIPLPEDVVTGKEFSEDAAATLKLAGEVAEDDMIFDIGPQAAARIASILEQAGTILWNGPVGVFEFEQFSAGTEILSRAIADSQAFSVAGGGDTLAAIDKFAIADKVSYISTGGGAFLEYVEGKTLPAVAMLEQRAGKG